MHGIPVLLKDNIDVVGMANSAGSLALAEPSAAQRRLPRRTVARGRRGDRRQDEPERVGQLQVDAIDLGLELSRRADEEPVRARSQSVRVQLRHGRGHRGKPRRDRRRHRNRRQHHLPGVGCRPCRPQADGGAGQPPRHHPDLGLAGHRRADGAHRRRRRVAARARSRRSTIATPRGRPRADPIPADYLASLDAGALKGKRFGVLRQAMGFHPDVDKAIGEGHRSHEGERRRGRGRQDRQRTTTGTIPSSRYCCTSSRTGSTRT